MAKRGTALSPEQQADYRRAVSRVNKQLYRLEKHYAATGENIMATAYLGLQRDIKSFFGDQKRFSKSMPATVREYQKRMNAIRRFYEKPTSTITGAKNVFQKRAESISAWWGAWKSQQECVEELKNIGAAQYYQAWEGETNGVYRYIWEGVIMYEDGRPVLAFDSPYKGRG